MAGPFRRFAYESLGSTNDEALARLRAGDPGQFFVTAVNQTSGRGRQGRAWVSPPGNFYASLGLRDPAPVGLAPQLGFVAGVALAKTLRAFLGGDARLRLKWPNDAVFAGAKLAGMLLESTTLPDGSLACVVGIGVNCVSSPVGLPYLATHLRAAGAKVGPEMLLPEFAANLAGELATWQKGAAFALIRERWMALAAGFGEPIVVRTPRLTLHGVFRDLDPSGRLLLDTATGLVSVDAGDVFFSVPVPERIT